MTTESGPNETDADDCAAARELVTKIIEGQKAEVQTAASAELLPVVYDQLRRLAGRYLSGERDDLTIQPTILVHEAFLRLEAKDDWTGRAHFLGVAAKAMRHVLIDHIRARDRQKRGGQNARVTLQTAMADDRSREELDVLAIHEALEKLSTLDGRQARIVEMHYFGGMIGDEIAAALDVSRSTVVRELRTARAWLLRELDR